MTSTAELLLATQLEQAGIPFEREVKFHPERKWRADFMVGPNMAWPVRGRYLIEIDGGAWTQGRHVRGKGFEAETPAEESQRWADEARSGEPRPDLREALERLIQNAIGENEGCSHHYGNLNYRCSCAVPVDSIRAALATTPPAPEPLDYDRLLEVLAIQGRRGDDEAIDGYARRLWHAYVHDDHYSDIAPLNPGPPAPDRQQEHAALAAGTHHPAIDDFGNQYLQRATPPAQPLPTVEVLGEEIRRHQLEYRPDGYPACRCDGPWSDDHWFEEHVATAILSRLSEARDE